MGNSKPCPVCGGSGHTGIPITSLYMAKVNDYFTLRKDNTERHRVRLEILAAFHPEFLDKFEHGDDVAIFIIPLDKYSEMMNTRDIGEYMEDAVE